MWVKYIVPEDGDDFNHPNVFKIQVTANQDVNAIPLESIVKVLYDCSCIYFKYILIP